jgi:Acyl-CoA dehydrogenase N terminal.
MSEFVYDVRDLKFILNQWLDMEEIFKFEKISETIMTPAMLTSY